MKSMLSLVTASLILVCYLTLGLTLTLELLLAVIVALAVLFALTYQMFFHLVWPVQRRLDEYKEFKAYVKRYHS